VVTQNPANTCRSFGDAALEAIPLESDFGHFRMVTFDTIFRAGAAAIVPGTDDGLPGPIRHIMKYRATTKLFSAAALTSLALLVSSGAGAFEERERAADQQLRHSVESALSADPYFYGAHVTTSVENGNVVLRGFVFSDWDLRDAIRIATRAAGGRRVVDDLTIEVGGRR
jgi:hypothetical protein